MNTIPRHQTIISGTVSGKRVVMCIDNIEHTTDLGLIRATCELFEQKIGAMNALVRKTGMWTADDRFNLVLNFLLNRSSPEAHLLYEFAVALRKQLKHLEAERLRMMREDALKAVGGAA